MKKIVLGLLIVFLLPIVSALDQELTIMEDGQVFVKGNTETDLLTDLKPIDGVIKGYTDELTYKKQSTWIFSYMSAEALHYDVKISLPKEATINKISTTKFL